MTRISGVNLPHNKKLIISLTHIYGIGSILAKNILNKANIDHNKLTSELLDNEIIQIRKIIEKHYIVEGDLRRSKSINIKRLIDLGCYRGLRHKKNLPVRGQRTHSNSKTKRKQKHI